MTMLKAAAASPLAVSHWRSSPTLAPRCHRARCTPFRLASPASSSGAAAASPRIRGSPALKAVAGGGGAPATDKKLEYMKGCRTVMSELSGLDFSRLEAQRYIAAMKTPPKGVPRDFDFKRAGAALAALLAVDAAAAAGAPPPASAAALDDLEGLQAAQAILQDIWRWRRRGGGMGDEVNVLPHQQALAELQNMDVEDIDRVTSSLLDGLNMTESEKREMGRAVEQGVMAGINGGVWGTLIVILIGIAALNFVRPA